jgi:hypothetical protein
LPRNPNPRVGFPQGVQYLKESGRGKGWNVVRSLSAR